MTVRVDLPGILGLAEAREWASVPFVFVPEEPATADQVLDRVHRAAVPAAEAAEQRHPEDPMWCAWLDASPKGVEGDLQDGPMTPEEVEAWFTDFRDALEREGLIGRLDPLPADPRLPNLDDWRLLAPATTCYLLLPPASPELDDWASTATLRAVLPDLVAWATAATAATAATPTTILERGLTQTVTEPGLALGQLLAGVTEVYRPMGLSSVILEPRRLTAFSFRQGARAATKVYVEDHTPVETFPQVLDSLRILGPHCDNAFIRRAAPTEMLGYLSPTLNREPTPAEARFPRRGAEPHFRTQLVEASVAQVLTPVHVARLPSGLAALEELYHLEPLANDRYLVHAIDPASWLTDLNPDPDTLAHARTMFGDALYA